jgi:hypothetical protein
MTLKPFVLILAATLAAPVIAGAATVVLDGSTGTLYDGLLDGWPGGPPDGVADFAGNALSVALRSGQPSGDLDMRGIGEFPLASLAAIDPGDIEDATLTFYVDDVISTFGPGATFDGTAAEQIVLFSYGGNGTIDLADFQNVAGAPLAVVTPGPGITDATLAVSGPLQFDVPLTAQLVAALTGAAPALGIVWATTDNLTATSLDGLSPPGVPGASAPFITVTIAEHEPPVFERKALGCQRAIASQGARLATATHTALSTCMNTVLAQVAAGRGTAGATVTCGKQLDETNPQSALAKAVARFGANLVKPCLGISPADINSPCDESAADIPALAACVAIEIRPRVQELVRTQYADACTLLTAVGFNDEFPIVCAP